MNNFDSQISDEISVLYELSLAACYNIDIKENAFWFQKTLMSRKNLSSAVYIKIFRKEHIAYCIPKNVFNEDFKLTDDFIRSFMKRDQAKILNDDEIKIASQAFNRTEKHQMCFLLGDFSMLIIGRELKPFQEIEMYQLQRVIGQFGHFMNGLFSREDLRLENEKRVKTEIQLREKNDELNKYISSNLQLENFAYIASHDLKAPIRNIKSFSMLLADKISEKIDEDELKFLNIIQNSSEHMIALIDDLLMYSKIESSELNLEVVNINDVIHAAIAQMRYEIDSKKTKIDLILGDQMIQKIQMDKIKMQQVVQNLIQNSINFSPVDIETNIAIETKFCEKGLLVTVADNGISVDAKHHTKVFEMFKKLKATENGSGMGLAICKKIIEKHQGDIWMEASGDHGTQMSFTLPVSKLL